MARYAENTTVSVERTQAEIQRLIQRYGARNVAHATNDDARQAAIQFEMHDRRVSFRLQLPDPANFRRDSRGRQRTQSAWQNAYDQECRRLWRSLLLVIKAKLESVESGVESFEEAFLPQIMIPGAGGQTYGDFAIPQIAESYRTNSLPALLPGAWKDC